MSLLIVTIPIIVIEVAVIVAATRPSHRDVTQHEGDIRLPFKRYRELYPHTRMTYEEYKQMQSRDSFSHTLRWSLHELPAKDVADKAVVAAVEAKLLQPWEEPAAP